MSDYRAQLVFSLPTPYSGVDRLVFRVSVECTAAENMPIEIFLHRRSPVDAEQDQYKDDFMTVCGVYDFSAYPVNNPDPEASHPYFRKATADFLTPSLETAQQAIAKIREYVTHLCRVQSWLDTLSDSSTEWIPDSPVTTSPPTTAPPTTPAP